MNINQGWKMIIHSAYHGQVKYLEVNQVQLLKLVSVILDSDEVNHSLKLIRTPFQMHHISYPRLILGLLNKINWLSKIYPLKFSKIMTKGLCLNLLDFFYSIHSMGEFICLRSSILNFWYLHTYFSHCLRHKWWQFTQSWLWLWL